MPEFDWMGLADATEQLVLYGEPRYRDERVQRVADYLRERVTNAFVGREEHDRLAQDAITNIARLATEAGEAKGRLEASEMAGVVQGWIDRAAALEEENKRLKEVLKRIAFIADDSTMEERDALCGISAYARAALEPKHD